VNILADNTFIIIKPIKKEFMDIKYLTLIFFILFAFYPISVASEWATPKQLLKVDGKAWLLDSFTDGATGRTHVLFTLGFNPELFYVCILKDRIEHLTQIGLYGAKAFISGTADGKNIYIAFLNKDHKIEFVESDDSGESFKKSVKLSDRDDCAIGSLAYIKETGRLYITFRCNKEIMFATRPAGTINFVISKITLSESPYIDAMVSCYTMDHDNPLIHLIWLIQKKVKYISSKDNGLTWSSPRDLPINPKNGIADMKFISVPAISKAVFIIFKTTSKYALIYSMDNCETFTKEVDLDSIGLTMPHAELYGSNDKKFLITTGRTYKEWSGWESGNIVGNQYDTPFGADYSSITSFNAKDPFTVTMLGQLRSDNSMVGITKKTLTIEHQE